jgi:hypothetical protein
MRKVSYQLICLFDHLLYHKFDACFFRHIMNLDLKTCLYLDKIMTKIT